MVPAERYLAALPSLLAALTSVCLNAGSTKGAEIELSMLKPSGDKENSVQCFSI